MGLAVGTVLIGASLSEPRPTLASRMVDFSYIYIYIYIRESVDSLYRDGADAQYIQYLTYCTRK